MPATARPARAILRLQQRLDAAFTALDGKASAGSSDEVLDAIVGRVPGEIGELAGGALKSVGGDRPEARRHLARNTDPERSSACC